MSETSELFDIKMVEWHGKRKVVIVLVIVIVLSKQEPLM